MLRRVGNGPRHRRPCRCYIRHAARRHGNTVRPCGSPMDPMHDRDRSCRAAGLDPPWRRSCPASDRPPREQGTRGRSSGAGRRTVGRTGSSYMAAWAERAADLGWDMLASGGKISSMETDWATIEINGAQRIIHRRPSPANFVLPWRRRATARSPLTVEPAPVVMGDGPGRCRRRPGPPRPTTRRRYRPRSPMPRTIPDPCRAATANQTTAPGVVTYQRMPESQRIAGARS